MFLADYLDAAMGQPWSWGRMDCCFFAGDWICVATGRDPLAPYRGTYDSALGARRLVNAPGGLVGLVGAEMTRCGFERSGRHEDGDIAVVEVEVPQAHAAAHATVMIRSGPWWVGRALDGLVGLDVRPLAAWRVL